MPISSLPAEIFCNIVSRLDLPSFCNFRLSGHVVEAHSRYSFTRRFLKSARLLITHEQLSSFLQICDGREDIVCSVNELYLSAFLPDQTRFNSVNETLEDIVQSGLAKPTYLDSFIDGFLEHGHSEENLTTLLAMAISRLPNLRSVTLRTAPSDVAVLREAERKVLKELTLQLYQRSYHTGAWKYMRFLPTRSMTIMLNAIKESQPRLQTLVIDRTFTHDMLIDAGDLKCRDYTTTMIPSFEHLRPSLESLHTLELSIEEHTLGGMICQHINGFWPLTLIMTASALRHLILDFKPPVSLPGLLHFLGPVQIGRLQTLTVSGLASIPEDSEMSAFVAAYPSCEFTFLSGHHSVQRALDLFSRKASNVVARPRPRHFFGRHWFGEPLPNQQLIGGIDWSRVWVQLVDCTRGGGQSTGWLQLDPLAYVSWPYFLSELSRFTGIAIRDLSDLHIVHVSTDGIVFVQRMSDIHIDGGEFERNLSAASCWRESKSASCFITFEICLDAPYWARIGCPLPRHTLQW